MGKVLDMGAFPVGRQSLLSSFPPSDKSIAATGNGNTNPEFLVGGEPPTPRSNP